MINILYWSISSGLALFLVLFLIDRLLKGKERRRVERLESDMRYVKNNRNGWDW